MTLEQILIGGLALLVIVLACALVAERRRRKRLRVRLQSARSDLLKAIEARRRLGTLEARRVLDEAGREARLPLRFTSQYGEDGFLFELFARRLSGVYVEVGAYDGVTLSVTYPFEALGWTGVLVEPLPERCAECRDNRPHSRVVHAALSRAGSEGTVAFTAVEGSEHSDTLSYLGASDRHLQQVRAEGARARSEPTQVPLSTMDAVLEEHEGPIDFVVIDVEGGELDLLDGFDLDRFRPRVLVIEDKALGRDDALVRATSPHGYVDAGWVGINRILVLGTEADLVERARELASAHPVGP